MDCHLVSFSDLHRNFAKLIVNFETSLNSYVGNIFINLLRGSFNLVFALPVSAYGDLKPATWQDGAASNRRNAVFCKREGGSNFILHVEHFLLLLQ